MPIINLENPAFISVDGAGRPNAGGTVGVYVADGLFSTFATIYSDQVKTTALTNPITLDSAGAIEIWYDVKVDIRELTKAGVLIRDTLNLDPNAAAESTTGYNLAQNGSFETDSTSDGQPDSWTISPYTGSAIAITETVVTDGVKALEFNTAAVGTGGGTATSAKFPVTESEAIEIRWAFYANNATTLNTFQIKWYTEADADVSTITLTNMPASGSVPTSWTTYYERIVVPATATQGEIVLTGIASGGSNLSSKAYFDGLKIIEVPDLEPVIYDQLGVAKVTSTATGVTLSDDSGNEILIATRVATAVNEITVTNAATGNPPTISTSGEADIGIDFENDQGEELLKLSATATAVNEITIANAATGNRPTISTSGEADIGIDFENDQGEELLELVAVASAVNNVRITNAVTTAAAIIDVSETNGDLELTRNGTGEITVDAVPIYGLVIADTPVVVLTDATTNATTQTAVDITSVRGTIQTAQSIGDVVAQKAILNVQIDIAPNAAIGTAEVMVGEGGETLTNGVHRAVEVGTNDDGGPFSASNEITINLAAGEVFDYKITQAGTAPTSRTVTIYLAGWYV